MSCGSPISSRRRWEGVLPSVRPAAPDTKQALLQGWATLENLSGQDWNGVELTLVSGEPVTFRQQLYRTHMVDRPEAPVEVVGRLLPGVDQGAIEDTETDAAPQRKHAALRSASALARRALSRRARAARGASARRQARSSGAESHDVAAADETVTAQEGLTQVSFHTVSGQRRQRPHAVAADHRRPCADRASGALPERGRRASPFERRQLTNDGKRDCRRAS